jgi:DNA polymerase-3 subunit epsilon
MALREIVLDTETTGLDPSAGHRIVEVACIELQNHVPTGRTFHRYVNPERGMPSDAFAIHGLSDDFLAKHPVFPRVVDEFLAFVADSPLVIHNAKFDIGFLNAELRRIDRPALDESRAIDTVSMARRKFPGAPASLDALCRRFNVDNSGREKHGALLDAELLAGVYLELIGGREPALALVATAQAAAVAPASRIARPPRLHAPTGEEAARHAAFIATLKDPIWSR